MTVTDTVSWDAGPGTWAADATHQRAPHGRFHEATFVPAYTSGFAEGMAAIGSPLETIEAKLVNGWLYTRPVPLGGGSKAGPPPKVVFEVLFRVHPALRRRLRTARHVFDDRPWVHVIERWRTIEFPALRRRLDEIASVDVTTTTDVELAAHVETIAAVTRESTHIHFAHAPWNALVVGEFLVRCENAGISGPDAMQALTGTSRPVRRPTELADAIVDALRKENGVAALDAPAAHIYDAIASVGPRSQAALQTYLDEVGPTIAGGETVADPTVAEQPSLVQTLLRSRLDAEGSHPAGAADEAGRLLAERVPAAERDEWCRALADARVVAPLRDDDIGVLTESMGRARVALLAVGARLVERGVAITPEDAFELRPDEVGPTLAGSGVDAERLRGWVADRERQATLDRPGVIGPPPEPPPIDRFPGPIARVTRAAFAFISRFDAGGDRRDGGGHGVSPGEVTARAVVIRDVSDLDRVEPGDILVAVATMPTFNTVMAMCGGVVTETGGAICHAAIMSRELGIPGVVGHPDALSIPDGATIHVDGSAGTVTVLPDQTAV